MLSFDSQTFSWLGRRLMSYAKGGTTTNYTYNSDGIRTKKVSGSTTTDYCLNGTQVLAEKRGGMLINYFYASDGTRVGFKTGGKVYYYVYNLQGDVTHIVDESKNIVATYRYDPFGKILNLSSLSSIGKLNPFRYRGYYYDTESNLYYLNSRYYNPEIGRFINADGYVTTGQGVLSSNMFAYCLNNPIRFNDHSGMLTGVEEIAVISFAVVTLLVVGIGSSSIVVMQDVQSASYDLYAILNEACATLENKISVLLAKESKRSKKQRSTDKPSWVNKDMLDSNLSAQENAKRILDNKYGPGNWKKGPGTDYNKIVKWITRNCSIYEVPSNINSAGRFFNDDFGNRMYICYSPNYDCGYYSENKLYAVIGSKFYRVYE